MWSRISHSRKVKFLLVHAGVSVIAGAMYLKDYSHEQGAIFPRYFIAAVEAFVMSLAAGFLNLGLLVKDAFSHFANTGVINIAGHGMPMPLVAGIAAVLAFLFAIMGANARGKSTMYAVYALSSMLFMYCGFVYFIGMPSATERLLRF